MNTEKTPGTIHASQTTGGMTPENYPEPPKIILFRDNLPKWIQDKILSTPRLKTFEKLADTGCILDIYYFLVEEETIHDYLETDYEMAMKILENLLGVSKAFQLPDWITRNLRWDDVLLDLYTEGKAVRYHKITAYKAPSGKTVHVHALVLVYDDGVWDEYEKLVEEEE